MYLKQNFLALVSIFILFVTGSLLIFVSHEVIISFFIYAIAVLLIIMGINFLVVSNNYVDQDKKSLLFQSLVLLTVGVALLVMPKGVNDWIFRVIIGIILIVYPLINLLTVKYKKEQFKRDLPKYILGLIFILSLNSVLKVLMIIVGSIIIGLGIWLIVLLIRNRKNTDNPNIIFNLGIKYFIKKGQDGKWE